MSDLYSILSTHSTAHFDLAEKVTIPDSNIIIAIDKHNSNIILYTPDEKDVVTVYGGEAVDLARMILIVDDGIDECISIQEECDAGEDIGGDEKEEAKQLCFQSSQTYSVRPEHKDLSKGHDLFIEDDEDLDHIVIKKSDAIEVSRVLLNLYHQLFVLNKK